MIVSLLDLQDFEVACEVNAHKWKEQEAGRSVTASWCSSAMSVAEELCDLFSTVDVKALRTAPRGKISAPHTRFFF